MIKLIIAITLSVILSPFVQRLTASHSTSPPLIVDTLIDLGGHQLHFHIWKGKSPVILFETGGGDDLTVWKDILAPIYQATGATLITYSRAGFGKSELDSNQITLNQQVSSLKAGLSKLKLDHSYFLVGHSFGGYFATLFAARYPDQVKGVVLIDANHVNFYTDDVVRHFQTQFASVKDKWKKEQPGNYWMLENAMKNRDEMRRTQFPVSVPAIDILAGNPPYGGKTGDEWVQTHKEFVAQSPKRKLIIAAGSGHYIMRDKPDLVVQTISQLYEDTK